LWAKPLSILGLFSVLARTGAGSGPPSRSELTLAAWTITASAGYAHAAWLLTRVPETRYREQEDRTRNPLQDARPPGGNLPDTGAPLDS